MFRDRTDAGERLAQRLLAHRWQDPLVLGLPRGGVPVACEIARALGAELDVWVVRKLSSPLQPELGVGAVGEGGAVWLDGALASAVGLRGQSLREVLSRERTEVERRVQRFREGRPAPALAGRTVILVDDGIATGGTVRAAITDLRERAPAKLVLAVPVAAAQSLERIRDDVDEVVCLLAPWDLGAGGAWYQDFRQVSGDEVVRLLREHARGRAAPAGAPA